MADKKPSSHRSGPSQGSKRPGGYSERYNRPNPYTGYLPPGTAPAQQIYHPESVDPVRIKQLEREQEQARLHAFEDKANLPHTVNNPTEQGNTQRQQRTQAARPTPSRSAQEAMRNAKKTRRAQVAEQQRASRAASYRAPVSVGADSHLNEIRQSAIDEAEKLRSQHIDEVVSAPAAEAAESMSKADTPKESLTAGLPVAGAAQFSAMNPKPADTELPEQSEENLPVIDTAPAIIPTAVEVITAEPIEDVAEEEVLTEETAEAVSELETELESEESTDIAQEAAEPVEEIIEAPEENNTTEKSEETADAVLEEDKAEETIEEAPVITEEAEIETEVSDDISEAPDEPAEAATNNEPSEDIEAVSDETEEEEEEEDDVKVYIPHETHIEDSEEDIRSSDDIEDFDDDYYEYEDYDEQENEQENIAAPIITTPVQAPRRNFETRISSELADPSAYSPGVAQDDTLFIRKKRPEEATAVFVASTPGMAPEFDDDDFFEQWLEEGDDMIIKDKRQRRKVSAIIGGATMFFAVIGFIFVVIWFINGIPGGSKTSSSQTDYAKFILPVVNADPEAFETITSVDNNVLVEAAINRLTYGEAAADQTYTALEVENETRLLIPSADVEKSGKVLFGDTFTIDFTVMYAIEDEKIYYYSAADDCFHVITTSGDIEPEIIKISHIGSRTQVLLEVGYISASEETLEGSDYYKLMEYVLNAKEGGGYYVSAIRAIETK